MADIGASMPIEADAPEPAVAVTVAVPAVEAGGGGGPSQDEGYIRQLRRRMAESKRKRDEARLKKQEDDREADPSVSGWVRPGKAGSMHSPTIYFSDDPIENLQIRVSSCCVSCFSS